MLKLTPSLRKMLKKPLGKLLRGSTIIEFARRQKTIAAVGDATAALLLKHKIMPNLAVFDFHIQRKKAAKKAISLLKGNFKTPMRVKNTAGTISAEALRAIKAALEKGKKRAILVKGEEDLLTLPAILFAKKNSCVLYGQPKKGVVAVKATISMKKKIRKMLRQMRKP